MGSSCCVVRCGWLWDGDDKEMLLGTSRDMHEREAGWLCDDDFLSFFTYTEMSIHLLWRRYPLRSL